MINFNNNNTKKNLKWPYMRIVVVVNITLKIVIMKKIRI